MYTPTAIEVGTLVGSFGLFFSCFLLFIRLLPMIATWEVKGLVGAREPGEANDVGA
jgi:molybdopterin-containing oxidoreductase family membrane subunit